MVKVMSAISDQVLSLGATFHHLTDVTSITRNPKDESHLWSITYQTHSQQLQTTTTTTTTTTTQTKSFHKIIIATGAFSISSLVHHLPNPLPTTPNHHHHHHPNQFLSQNHYRNRSILQTLPSHIRPSFRTREQNTGQGRNDEGTFDDTYFSSFGFHRSGSFGRGQEEDCCCGGIEKCFRCSRTILFREFRMNVRPVIHSFNQTHLVNPSKPPPFLLARSQSHSRPSKPTLPRPTRSPHPYRSNRCRLHGRYPSQSHRNPLPF